MKSSMVSGLVLAAGMCLSGPVLAQGKAEPTAPTKEQQAQESKWRAEQEAEVRAQMMRLDVDFSGGSVRDYVAALRLVTKPSIVNVVAPEAVLNVKLGELSLRQVTVETAVKSVEWAIEPRGSIIVQQIGPNSYGLTSGRRTSNLADTPAPASSIQVLSLKELTDPLPSDTQQSRVTVEPDVVLTAVRTALESSQGEQAELKYHADSGLLIVRGAPDQLAAASSVLDRMQTDMRMRRKSLKDAAVGQANIDELRGEAEKHAIRHQLLEENFMRARQEVSKAEEMTKQGVMSQGDYNSARASLDRAKAELETAKIDAAMARARLESVERRMADAGAGARNAEGGGQDFPAGRSTVTYSSKISGKDLDAVASAAEILAERLTGKNVAVRAEGDTLSVTAEPDAHRMVHRALVDPANAKGLFVLKSKGKATEEKTTR
jgi:hypothetical protein